MMKIYQRRTFEQGRCREIWEVICNLIMTIRKLKNVAAMVIVYDCKRPHLEAPKLSVNS